MLIKKIILYSIYLIIISQATYASVNQSIQSNLSIQKIESITPTYDRFENYNRNAYRMNDKLDKAFIRKTTVGYVTYVPAPIRNMLQNFFNNLRDFVSLGNDILQLKGMNAMSDFMRISINSTFGIVGIIDISSHMGLTRKVNTFGNTLKVYGWESSSYYVIPFLGPSTVRDTIGMVPDVLFNPTWWLISNPYISVGLYAINSIDTRAQYLGYDDLLNNTIDPYATMRDTYMQSIGEPIQNESSSNDVSIDSLLE